MTFNYAFGSSEYFNFENTPYNDVFGFFLSGPGISGPYSNGAINLATVTNSTPELPITVSSVNIVTPINQQYFIDNRSGFSNISYVNGFTTVFTAIAANLQVGQTYSIRLAIADGTDNNLNSYVWLDNFSLASNFTPTVSASISDNACQAITDLTISLSQDPGEEDIDYATFSSNAGSFNLSSLNIGDVVGSAVMNLNLNSFNASLEVSSITSASEVEIEAIDLGTNISLGTFILKNLSSGVEIFADSPYDGNNYTSGNSSVITFNSLFQNPSSDPLIFSFNLSSELGCDFHDNEHIPILCCPSFNPLSSVSLADYNCQATTDLSLYVSQSCNEEDIDYAVITSDEGSFDFSSLALGDNIGLATMNLSLVTITADIIINNLISPSEIEVEAIDLATGASLGTFILKNLTGGGIEVYADSPPDGNNYTSGNSSTITFFGIFQNPNTAAINFIFDYTSELGSSFIVGDTEHIICCQSFSPNISYTLADSYCVLTDLSINVSQVCNEEDINNAIFTTNDGSFDFSTVTLSDIVGSGYINLSTSSFNVNLEVSAILSPSEIQLIAIDIISGSTLALFSLKNLSVGVEINTDIFNDTPGDGDNFTTGNNSSITLNNIFENPSNSPTLTFTSTFTSELGSNDVNSYSFPIYCIPNIPRLTISSSDPSCPGYNDAFLDLSGTGGTGLYNYQLFIYDSTFLSWIAIGQSPLSGLYTANPVSFTNLYAGCYLIILEDDAGVSESVNICLVDPAILDVIEIITPASPSINNDGSIVLSNVTGGTGSYLYTWTGPNSFSSSSQDIFNLESGNYTLVVTDDNLCSQTFVFFVDLLISGCTDSTANNFDPTASFDNGSCCYLSFYDDNIILCLGDSLDLIYSGSSVNVDDYLWSTGDTTSSLLVSPNVNTTYWLQQTTNGFYCYDTVSVTISCLSFSPSVSVSLSDLNCSLTDLTINVAQDSNEVDMDVAVFTSNEGFFTISTMNIGDNIGNSTMDIGPTTINANLLVSSITSSSEIIVEAINQFSGSVLGTFVIKNLVGGGVEIIASSPGDGNSYTLNGNNSTVTFVNVFDSQGSGFLSFTSNITSEIGDVDFQVFPIILNCVDFSPLVSVALSNTNCQNITDLTINISQDHMEVDMDTAIFTSDGGYFLISSISVGDNLGIANMNLNLNSFTSDLIVSSIVSSSEIIVEAIDQLTGAVLGNFTIKNLVGGGVKIYVISPDDGNLYTFGNSSSVTFYNSFHNPNSSNILFSSNIISELGNIDQQTFSIFLNCTISPIVTISVSDLDCDLTDLTITIAQDSNEVDIDTAFFNSDGGSFIISTLNIGDNIGSATMNLSLNTFSADLFVNSIVSPSEIIVEAIDQLTGALLGTFTINNLVGGGVEIISVSPDDGNLFTSGHISSVTFNNIFLSPSTGFLNFTSTIISETGQVDIQDFLVILNCTNFSPTVIVSLSDLTCGVLADLTISVSQDSNEVDMDTAIFISDGGSFTISTMTVGDTIGTASMLLSGSSFITDLIVDNIVSSSQITVQAVDTLTGSVLGTFSITNLVGGGVEIIAISPSDGNTFTHGNSSVVSFTGVFITSSAGLLTFTSSIASEIGDLDVQTSSFAIGTISSFFTIFRCDTYSWNGNVFNSTGIYVDTMSSIIGCDSVVTLNLTIYYSSISHDTVSVCDSYLWNGILFDSSGVYIDTIVNNVGCDSIMYLHLSVNANFSNHIANECNDYLWNGVLYDSSGIYIDTLINSFGCDSVVTIDLTINYSSISSDSVIACDSYLWNGINYDTSGVYYSGGRGNNYSMNFDGINDYVSLNSSPVYGPTTSSDFTISIWVNPNVSHLGMIVNQYENVIPANSNYFLALNSDNSFRVSGNGTNYYDFGSANIGGWQYVSLVFNSSGSVDTYIDGLSTGSSALNLLSSVGSMPLEIGDILTGGSTGFIGPFNGMLDNIDIWNSALSQQDLQDNMICSPKGGESDLVGFWNFEEGVGTTAYDLTPNSNDGVINGAIYDTDAPIQSCSLTNVNGCDSTSVLYLTINYTLNVLDTITTCDSLLWNGTVYDSSGTYVDTLISTASCDSIVTLFLIVNNSTSSTESVTACDSYTWNGITYNSSGIYDTIFTNIAGCDSFTEIYLTIIPSVNNTLFVHACGSYFFDGNLLFNSGIYYDTLIALNGCDSVVILDLLVTDQVQINSTIVNVGCYGDSTGQIDIDVIGGSPPFSFQWSNGSILSDINNLFGDSLYSCTIIDSAGCRFDTSIFVSQPSLLSVSTSISNVSCFQGNDGSISLDIIGGVVPYNIDWGSLDSLNLIAGFYTYLVSDSNSCIVFDSVEVTQENPILINLNIENIQCFGQATGFIETTVLPGSGVPGYTYEWIGPNLFSSNSDDIYNLFAGDYYLVITDANLCEFDTMITLIQPINLPQNTNIQISNYSGFNIRCKGDNSGWVSVEVSGGYGPYSYLWSNLSTSDSVYDLFAGTYVLEVTDSIGCVIIFDFPLIEPAEALSTTIIATTDYNGYNISCYGLGDAALQGIASGGVPEYDYYWNSVLQPDSITGLFLGDYELTVYDKNNCISTSNITLIEPDSLILDINSFTDTCSKGVGRAVVNVSGGVNPFSYNWSTGSTNPTINDFSEGEYQVIVTDANLCQVSDSVIIFNLPSPIIDFGIYPNNQRLFDQLDDPIVFVDRTDGIWQNIVEWNWDYDDGGFGSDSISYHSYSDTGSFVVMLTTISQYNCIDTLTKIVVISDYNLYIPNAFTPFSTNDDINNIFKAYGVGILNFKMEIFSRWGERIFTSNSIDIGWDGTSINDNQVPVGIYIYLIEAENVFGETFKYNGQVKLIR